MDKPKPKNRPLAVDHQAMTAKFGQPPFAARPTGAPVYYGFQVLADVAAQGFVLGKITDFEAEPTDAGDAFVIAPDDSRCGLVWHVSDEPSFTCIMPHENERWGVWAVNFPFPMTSREHARRNLEHALPRLQEEWIRWRTRG
jgi:hypothetical protein